jgi:hypothetical protein
MNDNEEENGDWIPDQVWNDKFGIVETGYRLSSVRRIIGGDYGDWIPDQVWNDKFGIVEAGFRVGAGKRAGGYTHTTLLLSK